MPLVMDIGFLPENVGVILPPAIWIFSFFVQGIFGGSGLWESILLWVGGGFRSSGTQMFVNLPKKRKGRENGASNKTAETVADGATAAKI